MHTQLHTLPFHQLQSHTVIPLKVFETLNPNLNTNIPTSTLERRKWMQSKELGNNKECCLQFETFLDKLAKCGTLIGMLGIVSTLR